MINNLLYKLSLQETKFELFLFLLALTFAGVFLQVIIHRRKRFK